MPSITSSTVTIQISVQSVPSTPSWFGEAAAFAQVLTHLGLLKAIQEHVRFARARFGKYDTIDFVVVLIGYALSGERTLEAFYQRLVPFADPFIRESCYFEESAHLICNKLFLSEKTSFSHIDKLLILEKVISVYAGRSRINGLSGWQKPLFVAWLCPFVCC